jgi:hypothetical protein
MPKYYTPKTAIRFANQDQAALRSMAQTVETTVQETSDKAEVAQDFSGVIRYRRDFRNYLVSRLKLPTELWQFSAVNQYPTPGDNIYLPFGTGQTAVINGADQKRAATKKLVGMQCVFNGTPAPGGCLVLIKLWKNNALADSKGGFLVDESQLIFDISDWELDETDEVSVNMTLNNTINSYVSRDFLAGFTFRDR